MEPHVSYSSPFSGGCLWIEGLVPVNLCFSSPSPPLSLL